MRALAPAYCLAVLTSACEPDVPPVWESPPAPVERHLVAIAFTPTTLQVALGASVAARLEATWSDGSRHDITADATYWTSDEAICSVRNEPERRGLITARAAGRAVITAQLGAHTTTAVVDVAAARPTRLFVTPPSLQAPLGQRLTFEVLAEFSDGSRHPVEGTWTAADPGVLRLEGTSFVTQRAGATSVRTRWQGLSAEASVTVTPATVTRLLVTGPGTVLERGHRAQLTALAVFSDGATRDVSREARWSSSRADAVLVDESGLAVARLPGASVIGASWQGQFGSTLLTVTGDPPTTLEILPLTPIVSVGTARQLFAVAGFADGSTEDFSQHVTWLSPEPSVAALSNVAPGLLLGVGPGQVRLRVDFAGLSAQTTLTVVSGQVTGLEVRGPATLRAGQSAPLQAMARFSSGQEVDVSAHATWSSSSPAIGAVTNSAASRGLFTAVAPGPVALQVSWAGRSASGVFVVVP